MNLLFYCHCETCLAGRGNLGFKHKITDDKAPLSSLLPLKGEEAVLLLILTLPPGASQPA